MDIKLEKITEDRRGAIFLIDKLLPDNKEFTFLEMKKGSARGGCIHSNDEFMVVIKGKIKFICGDEEKELSAGESSKIPARKPHAFIAIEESIVSEWGITSEEKKLDAKDANLRAMVDELNKKNLSS